MINIAVSCQNEIKLRLDSKRIKFAEKRFKKLHKDYITFRFGLLVIRFADEFPVFHEIKLVAGVQLPRAKSAWETRQVINQLLRPSDHLRRRQALAAARAFRPETPATPTTYNIFTLHSHINDKTIRLAQLYRDSSNRVKDNRMRIRHSDSDYILQNHSPAYCNTTIYINFILLSF